MREESMFRADGIREVDYNLNDDLIKKLKDDWKNYSLTIEAYPNNFNDRGIVYCAGGLKYFTCAWISISILRSTGCSLPIEVWYYDNELSSEMIQKLKELKVDCLDLSEKVSGVIKGFLMKPLSILNSKFKEVLFLDADNICTADPSYLFESEEYKQNGSIFWPDYWKTSYDNPIWKIIGVDYFASQEQESGQLIINKSVCWKELNLAAYFNRLGRIYYNFLHGDKDTFRFAWLALGRDYFFINKDVATCGYFDRNGRFSGHTMVQHGPNDEILFLHRNLVKWDVTLNEERLWEKIKSFQGARSEPKEYSLFKSSNCHPAVDISGNIKIVDFNSLFPGLELECLSILKLLRESDVYKRALQYSYIIQNREFQPRAQVKI
jgi:alpha 1,2-mannosyltransferase